MMVRQHTLQKERTVAQQLKGQTQTVSDLTIIRSSSPARCNYCQMQLLWHGSGE
jgi:hypothetical protein